MNPTIINESTNTATDAAKIGEVYVQMQCIICADLYSATKIELNNTTERGRNSKIGSRKGNKSFQN